MRELFAVIKPFMLINVALAALVTVFIWMVQGQNKHKQAIYQSENHRYEIDDIDDDHQDMEAKIQYLERKLAKIQDNQISSPQKNKPVISRPKAEAYSNSPPNSPQADQNTNTQLSTQYHYRQNSSIQETNPSKVSTAREISPLPTPNSPSSVKPQSTGDKVTQNHQLLTEIAPKRTEPTEITDYAPKKSLKLIQPTENTKSQASKIDPEQRSRIYANDISEGLQIADARGTIKRYSRGYYRVQTAIRVLRKGESLEKAAAQSRMSPDTLQELIEFGQNQPNIIGVNETILHANSLKASLSKKNSKIVESPREQSIRFANDIRAGLLVADKNGQLKYRTRNYYRVQTAIRALRKGKTLSEAAQQSGIKLSVLDQLVKWGQERAGSPVHVQ